MTTLQLALPQNSRDQILAAATSIGMLTSSGPGGSRVVGALCNPRLGARELVALIRKEPVLYARILRVANSAYYHQPRTVKSIDAALMLLGIDAVRGIAAAAALDRALPSGPEFAVIDLRAVLRHSIATAVAAEEIANRYRASLASDAFVAGLLHHLGIPVQLRLDPSATATMIAMRKNGDLRDMRMLEEDAGAPSHELIIQVIAKAWRLPTAICVGAGFHHHPEDAPDSHRDLATLVDLAANLALILGYTSALEPAALEWNLASPQRLQLEPWQVERVGRGLNERIEPLLDALTD